MREKPRTNSSTMALKPCSSLLALMAMAVCFCPLVEAGERWSRQLTEFTGGHVTGNDWIPLSRPGSERQAGARVLNYFTAPQQSFLGPDSTAQPQQHHFTFLNHQFPQSNRFVLQQPPQHQRQELLEQHQPFHLASFQRTPPFVGQTIQHPPPPPPPSTNPFDQQFLSKSPLSETLIQDDNKQPSPSLIDQQSFSYQHIRQPEHGQTPAGHVQSHQQPGVPSGGVVSQEEVQLLYVPVETLYNQKQSPSAPENNRFNSLPQPVSPSLINDFYTSAATTTTSKPPRTSAGTVAPLSSQFPTSSSEAIPLVSRSSGSSSSGGSSKPKPNQPPLALFLYNDGRQGKLSTNDALGGLKNINEIAVLDAVGKNSPKVFIGPSGLAQPKSYSRFELPYLSSVDLSSNRSNRKIEELPFFVAPLSYKTPGGYSKISLPPPHVGSIVVRQSNNGNSLENSALYTGATAQPNVQYYTPSTLNFAETTTTKAPITLGSSGKPIFDTDHYTSPTRKPSSSDRSVSQYNSFNGPPPSRHAVNEEYFNLAKTRKPTTTSPTTSYYPFRSTGSTRQFDFKPMPEQKIPPSFYPSGENDRDTTTTIGTTTTEKPTTAQLQFESERMRTHFREENFRSRRPYHQQQTTTASTNDATDTRGDRQGHFVHKFKLVDSVRPTSQTKPVSGSVVDNSFLDFFSHSPQQHRDEMIKTTITTNLPGSTDRQVIRNNYFSAAAAINEDSGANRHKFVSTYYSPSSTAAGTTAETTTPATLTTQDLFFREFEQKSKFYEREPKYETSVPTTIATTGASYINKYRYETDSNYYDAPRYSVEVITTSEPTTLTTEPAQGTTDQKYYSMPSELPPISANLPGLVNALMDDQWPLKTSDRQTPATVSTSSANTRGPHFRKQLQRTTTPAVGLDSYDGDAVTTTRRPLQRGRRPQSPRTTSTPATGTRDSIPPASSTRAPISRSRSRYVPNNEERPASRGRTRSRSTTPRSPLKEQENLDYQRDVLKQNYPIIRPQGQSVSVATTPGLTAIATTPSTTLNFREVYEDQTERLISTTLANEVPLDVDPQQQLVTRKYSPFFSEAAYEPEATVTTVVPPQTTNYFVSTNQRSQQDDHSQVQEELVRSQEVIPLRRDPEQSVIPLRSQNVATEATPQSQYPHYESGTESEEKLTTAYGQPIDEPMEIKKVEIASRPRRPGLVSRQRDYQQTYEQRATTERTTSVRTTTSTEPPAPSVGSRTSGRRPAFVRRPSRLYATTTAAPTTTVGYSNDQPQSTQGSYTVRPKNRQDILRGRTRRPTTTTETTVAATTASPEAPVTRAFGRGNLRRISPTARSRQEQTAAPSTQETAPTAATSNGPRFRIRERTRFNLQPQESQWSSKLNHNSFQPVLKTESRSNDLEKENASTEPEPEIVTAARDTDMYFVNVSSNYGQKGIKQEAHAEDSTEHSVPSFADLLNDVMKDFIDDNSQKKPVTDNNDEEKQRLSEESRRPSNFRNNFLRKRGRSKAVDSFETAESQHINQAAHVYNGQPPQYGESVKNIDHTALSGKNAPRKESSRLPNEQQSEELENSSQEEATVIPLEDEAKNETETEETDLEVVMTGLPEIETGSPMVNSLSNSTNALFKPTEEAPTLASLEQTSTNTPLHQERSEPTTEASIAETPISKDEGLEENKKPQLDQGSTASGTFDAVKKMFSDYYKVVENDSETEEMVDGEEPVSNLEDLEEEEDLIGTDEPLAVNDELIPSTTDMAPSETQFAPVTAVPPPVNPMGSLVIPTSVSSGITHETEICYRGRCVKTEEDKRKRKFKLN